MEKTSCIRPKMDPVLTIPVLVWHSRNQSSSSWQIEDPIQFQFNIPETNPVPVEPHMLSDYWPFYFLYWPFYTRMHIYPRFDTCLKVAPSRLIHWISSYICGFVTLMSFRKSQQSNLVVSSNSLQNEGECKHASSCPCCCRGVPSPVGLHLIDPQIRRR